MAMYRHSVTQETLLQADPAVIIQVNKRQVQTMILFEVATVGVKIRVYTRHVPKMTTSGASSATCFDVCAGW